MSYFLAGTKHKIPQLIFNNNAVAEVNDQKYLGILLDSGLSSEKLLNELVINSRERRIYD